MAKPVTISASKLLIQLGDGASPEVFTAPCGLTTKGITFTKNMNDITVPDCDDPDAAAWVERGVVSLSAAISGNGVLAMEAQNTWLAAYQNTSSVNTRVLLTEATYGGHFEGKFHLSTLTENGALGDKVQVTVALDSDGPVLWVPSVP